MKFIQLVFFLLAAIQQILAINRTVAIDDDEQEFLALSFQTGQIPGFLAGLHFEEDKVKIYSDVS